MTPIENLIAAARLLKRDPRSGNMYGPAYGLDWACVDCVPESNCLVDDFLCAFHAIKSAVIAIDAAGSESIEVSDAMIDAARDAFDSKVGIIDRMRAAISAALAEMKKENKS
jgi:hypothetical protein